MEKRRERGLKQLPDGRWQFSWCYEGRYHRRITKTKGEARAFLEKIHTQIREGRYMERRKEVKIRFEEAMKKFLEWSEVNTRPDTYRNDRYYSERWRVFRHFAGRTLDRITPTDVEAYKAARASEKHGKGTVSTKTVDNDLARLKRMFSLCVTWGLCEKNPVKPVKFFKPESRRDRFLSPDEEQALLDKASPALKTAIIFSIDIGMRLGEMLSLSWAQVDLRRGEVTVTAEKAKGKRSRRIPLNAKARAALETLPRSLDPNALVFRHFDGRYSSPLHDPWERALKESGLSGVCWHTLRHTFASRLVMAGADLVTVQKLLGHTTLAMVLKYAHLAESHPRNAVTLLESDLRFTCDAPSSTTAVNTPAEQLSPLDCWRRERDSNPRTLAGQRFSRPPPSTARPSLRSP